MYLDTGPVRKSRARSKNSHHARNLPNVVRHRIKQTSADIFRFERPAFAAVFPLAGMLKDFTKGTRDRRRFKTELGVIRPVDIPDKHVYHCIITLF